ncbi:ORF6N domain-containing protein [Anaerococcus sp. AGMB00486]|uniref:ORF6N domain-containing protein n=2 Tax=Anaerococcus TaxID=165779 RepID=A0ABX2N819_9FIRM|nr:MULTISPECIES: ORF6N domain-containing protein [Anaerococcus]MSS77362.1 ORF6N domain-containing protein [Anaerococcus porci]NVF10837.1 ORF6N domain-containing protein [Anaerococcus faecalis]
MNNITINNNSIERKLYNNQPVVTFKDIDLVHERVSGTARRNFYKNQKHFIENEDYYLVTVENAKCTKFVHSNIPPKGQYFFTESGYLMLVKSFTDDLAWEVQRQLVNCYFREKEQTYQQLELEPYKLVKKTYKGKPVMTVNDLVYLTDFEKSTLNLHIRAYKIGTLLEKSELYKFKLENTNISNRISSLYVLNFDEVKNILKYFGLLDKCNNEVDKYFNIFEVKENKDSKAITLLRFYNLINLERSLNMFFVDKKLKEDLTEVISKKYIELGLLDKPCRNLSINTLEGWNLFVKKDEYKRDLIK